MSDKSLTVTVLKDGETFLEGEFGCSDEDYGAVLGVLGEVEMTREQATSLLSGYMHARDVGQVTEDMGKIALIATVYMLEEGETHLEIPLESAGEGKEPPRH
jgi:hypothetical protein